MINIEVSKYVITGAIEDNPEFFIKDIAAIYIDSGWDDVLVDRLSKSPNFIKELAELLVNKNMYEELADEVADLFEEY